MKKSAVVVIGIFILLYMIPLGVRPMVIPDETRYAEITREMIASGDWVVPHLDGFRYFEKPVLGYWLNAASAILFGQNAFAARFPSAMAVGISALFLFLTVRRFAGGYWMGIITALVFLTCMEVFGVGVFCVLDSIFSMFVTAALISFFFAYMEVKSSKKTGLLVLFGIFCGLAFLTKGFLTLAIPVMIIVPFMIWEGRWKDTFNIPWMLPIVAAAIVLLPWSIIILFRAPDFWKYFFWEEHIVRFMGNNAQHPNPFWYFIPVIVGGALPWTALFPAAISGCCKERLKEPLIRFAICWFFFLFLFFSASKGKLGTYILPCFPPLAILITKGLKKYLEGQKNRAFTMGASFLSVVTGVPAVVLVLSQLTDFLGFRAYGPGETWKWVAGTAGPLLWISLIICSVKATNFRKKLILYSAAPMLFMLSTHFIMPNQIVDRKAPGALLLKNTSRVSPDTVLVADGLVQAACWFYKRDDVYLLNGAGELGYGLKYDDSKHRLLKVEQFKKLIAGEQGKKGVILIAKTKNYVRYKSMLPKPIYQEISNRFAFIQFKSKRDKSII
jgi:4-amino-4-deoxy-L-arabinose transferase